MIAAIDHCDAHRRPCEIARDFKTAEAGSDNDDMLSGVDRHSRFRSMRSGIDYRSTALKDRAWSKVGRLQAALPHDVEKARSACEEWKLHTLLLHAYSRTLPL